MESPDNIVSKSDFVASHIPQISRSTTSRVFFYLRNNLVTSQIVFDECKTYVDAEWPLFAMEQPVAC